MKLAAKALKSQYLHPRLCFAVPSGIFAQLLGQKARFLLTYIAYHIHQWPHMSLILKEEILLCKFYENCLYPYM